MKRLKVKVLNFRKIIPMVALMLGMSTVSQACAWWFYQPKLPEAMKGKR